MDDDDDKFSSLSLLLSLWCEWNRMEWECIDT